MCAMSTEGETLTPREEEGDKAGQAYSIAGISRDCNVHL